MSKDDNPPGRDSKIHVLVVDDEPIIVEELMCFFDDEGITAIGAENALHALSHLENSAPGAITVILTDVRMPGQDGVSFAESIRHIIPECNAIEVILMTGHASLTMAVDALRTRAFDFLRKPITLNDLAASINRAHNAAMLRRRRAHSEQPDGHPQNAAKLSGFQPMAQELRHPLIPALRLARLIEDNIQQISSNELRQHVGFIRQSVENVLTILDAIEPIQASSNVRLPSQ